jgi:hypothetical protein
MSRLRLPRLPREPDGPLPPALARLAEGRPAAAVTALLTRREFLKATAVALVLLATPLGRVGRAWARARRRFFTRPELATLQALVETILPPGPGPGARTLGAADYIEGLLTAFEDGAPPRIFAGGPFSSRNPFANEATGRPSRRRPPNDFARFIPLTRLQELRWRAELYGSAAVRGADFNDGALGPLRGLRDLYREGLARVDTVARAMAGRPFARLPPGACEQILDTLDRMLVPDGRRGETFLSIVIRHTLEGSFAAPEYGGNRRARGWRLVRLEGDSHPLGYSIFSRDRNDYNERRGHPMSTPDPDELRRGRLHPRPLSADALALQSAIASLTRPFEDL